MDSQDLAKATRTVTSSRWQAKYWLLTYAQHLNKENVQSFFETIGARNRPYGIDELVIVHETGNTGHAHTHVYVAFSRMVDKRNPSWADIDGSHPNIVKVNASRAHRNTVIRYCLKDVTSHSEVVAVGINLDDYVSKKAPAVEKMVAKFDNVMDAVLACKRPGDVSGIIQTYKLLEQYGEYESDDECEDDIEDKFYLWQRELASSISCRADARTVVWRWDPQGNTGKTSFANWLRRKHDALVLDTTSQRDVARIFAKKRVLGRKWKSNIVVFDLTRQVEDFDSIYRTLEAVKNSRITSGKYDSEVVEFGRRFHVIVFANWPPKRSMLSADRWNVKRISTSSMPVDDGADKDTWRESSTASKSHCDPSIDDFQIPTIAGV